MIYSRVDIFKISVLEQIQKLIHKNDTQKCYLLSYKQLKLALNETRGRMIGAPHRGGMMKLSRSILVSLHLKCELKSLVI